MSKNGTRIGQFKMRLSHALFDPTLLLTLLPTSLGFEPRATPL